MTDDIPDDVPNTYAVQRAVDIARAILAEREACAVVADVFSQTSPVGGPHAAMMATVMSETGKQIAQAIRSRK